MEPLVFFGACLVVWCGYLAAIDAVRELKAVRNGNPVKRKIVKKRVKAFAAGIEARLPGGISIVKPRLQRI